MERKSFKNDIYNITNKDSVGLCAKLVEILGQDNPFAKISIGHGYYLWSDNRCDWYQMNSADELEQDFIREELVRKKKEVASVLDEKTADILFTVPDDSYIYYNADSGDMRVLIAGWGFKKPVRSRVKADTETIGVKNPVTLSFLYDGERLADYVFGVKTSKMVKRLSTDSTGYYHISNLKVGSRLGIVNLKTGDEQVLNVVDGRSDYEFDVTSYITVSLRAMLNGEPLGGEKATVGCRGNEYSAVTDADGSALIQIPMHEGETVAAEMRGETRSFLMNGKGNEFLFVFEDEKQPVPEADVNVYVAADGNPAEGADVAVEYAGSRYGGKTNAEGIMTLHLVVATGEKCTVSVADFDSQSKELDEDGPNNFRFEKASVVPPPTPAVRFSPQVQIEGDNGFIGNKYPITVEYDGRTADYVSDEDGIVRLPEMEAGKTMKVVDGLNPDNTAEYELDAEQPIYEFHVPYTPVDNDKDIKVTILDNEGKPIKCDRVRFMQGEGNELLSVPDAEGCTCFAKDTFKTGEPLTVSILRDGTDGGTITFTLDSGEYEYVLQEKNTNSAWLTILKQILAVLALIAFAGLFWPYFEMISYYLFKSIYH